MNADQFYSKLFSPIGERIGPIDDADIIPYVGFDRGGMIRLSTVDRGREEFVTYITRELAIHKRQQPAEFGRYEVLVTCDDEPWAREVLTEIGRMSSESVFEHGHALDIEDVFGADFPVQGLVVEEFIRTSIDGLKYGIFRIHGITRPELEFSVKFGATELFAKLNDAGVFPRTSTRRRNSVVSEPRDPQRPPTWRELQNRRLNATSSSRR